MKREKGLYPIDFVFMIIKHNVAIGEENLFEKNHQSLLYYQIDRESLKEILRSLSHDKKIFLNSSNEYQISPSANDFLGYFNQEVTAKRDTKKQKRKDLLWKVIPITLTIFSILYNIYLNNKKDELKDELAKKNITIDSLRLQLEVALKK